MNAIRIFIAGAASVGPLLLIAPTATADPLTQAEHDYLTDVRWALGDSPDQAKDDAQLLSDGYRACAHRAAGNESIELPGVSDSAAAYGLTHLCPAIGDF